MVNAPPPSLILNFYRNGDADGFSNDFFFFKFLLLLLDCWAMTELLAEVMPGFPVDGHI